jgi:hypothetical protein
MGAPSDLIKRMVTRMGALGIALLLGLVHRAQYEPTHQGLSEKPAAETISGHYVARSIAYCGECILIGRNKAQLILDDDGTFSVTSNLKSTSIDEEYLNSMHGEWLTVDDGYGNWLLELRPAPPIARSHWFGIDGNPGRYRFSDSSGNGFSRKSVVWEPDLTIARPLFSRLPLYSVTPKRPPGSGELGVVTQAWIFFGSMLSGLAALAMTVRRLWRWGRQWRTSS